MSPAEAIREACIERYRPIMMTTLAALVGALPILLDSAQVQNCVSLGLSGGRWLVFSQAITLFITPVIYLALDRYSGRAYRR